MMFLKQGSVRPVVTTLQVLLGDQNPDGIFGPKTHVLVTKYQAAHRPGLNVDGIVGKDTWTALMEDNDVVTVDVIDVDELVDDKGHRVANPGSTYTGQALAALKAAGADPITLWGQSNGVAQMVHEVMAKVGGSGRMALLRIYGHGAAGSQNVSAGKAALDEHVTSLDPVSFKWTEPSLGLLAPFFAPWGSMELHGCHVAQKGQLLLGTVARAVKVPVTAGLHFQYAGHRGQWAFDGPTVTVFPHGSTLKAWSKAAAHAASQLNRCG